MSDPTNTNDIDAMLRFLRDAGFEGIRAAITALVAERDALRKRVAELEAQQPSSDLRARLVCAALTGILAHEGRDREFDCVMDDAIWMAGKALAAMRKGNSNGK